MFDLLIIGFGPVGIFAATLGAMRKLKISVVEISATYGGKLKTYKDKLIYDIPGFKKITANSLIQNLYEQFLVHQNNVTIFYNQNVTKITNNGEYFIVAIDDTVVMTKKILISRGLGKYLPIKLAIPGANEINDIYYSVSDYKDFLNKKVIILGGGDSAVDFANMLSLNNIDTTLIHRRDHFRAKEESVSLLSQNKVKVLTTYQALGIEKEAINKFLIIKNLKTEEIKKIYFDAIIVCYGLLESSDIFQKTLNVSANGIIVNSALETSENGIFAIGDACFYSGKNKTLVSGFGEATNVINYIDNLLKPKKNPSFFSSINLKEKSDEKK